MSRTTESKVCQVTGKQKHTRDKAQSHLMGLVAGRKGCDGSVFKCRHCGWHHVAWTPPSGKRRQMKGSDRARRRREAIRWRAQE